MGTHWLGSILDVDWDLATGLVGLAASLGLFVLSQAALIAVLVALPTDFFCTPSRPSPPSRGMAVMRWAARVAKNVAGTLLILLGVPLTLPGIPGPGLVLVLVGVALLDFPGKRQLQHRLISHPRVFRSINSLRSRFGRPALIVCRPGESSTVTRAA